jgi:hypothetical protein
MIYERGLIKGMICKMTCYDMFPSMFINSLREFPKNCVYKQGGLNYFIEYLHRKLLTANFLSYDIESAKKKR